MKIHKLHDWKLSYADARKLQSELACQIVHEPIHGLVRTVAGLDCAFIGRNEYVIAAVVVLSFPDLQLIEQQSAVVKAPIPYIPGLLSFREGPACLAAAARLKTRPDVFLVDGQGIAHPRRLGLAGHLGLFLDTPAIGCAKSRLYGEYEEPARAKGSSSPLKDPDRGRVIGSVVRTRKDVRPIFVSVGHKCTLAQAVELTLGCTGRYRQPEPTRQADILVAKIKKQKAAQ